MSIRRGRDRSWDTKKILFYSLLWIEKKKVTSWDLPIDQVGFEVKGESQERNLKG